MPAAIAYINWNNYEGTEAGVPFFSQTPLTFNSRQERLHDLQQRDRLWLVSRCPSDQQYYFVGVLQVLEAAHNEPTSERGIAHGPYAIAANIEGSYDLRMQFPAEGLLRAFQFETGKPIRYGASIGQSLQTLRFLSEEDQAVLNAAFCVVLDRGNAGLDLPLGLWTKCDAVFAQYFLRNWAENGQAMAFLLYDPPPMLPAGSPIFIHSDKSLRLVAQLAGVQYVAGHKQTVDTDERLAERERIWVAYREDTIDAPSRDDFNAFWDSQNGIRGLVLMEGFAEIPSAPTFKDYGRALQWGYPMGVGYRYLTMSQNYLLLRLSALANEPLKRVLSAITRVAN